MPGPLTRLLLPLLALVSALLPLACTATALQRLEGRTMGTTWSVVLAGDPARGAELKAGIQGELDAIVAQMSTWEPGSDLSRYNRADAGTWHRLPPGASAVVAAALALAETSGGAFDPTVGPLVDAWGFGPAGAREGEPDPVALATARARVGWQRVQLRSDGMVLQPGGTFLDLSAIAKGHAVDRVAEWLRRAGAEAFLVEVGGELRARGRKPDGTPWRVAVESPAPDDNRSDDARQVVTLDGMAIATSGDYRRQRTHGDQRLSHILDPRTGAPARHALASVTILHPEAMHADALATTLHVLGPREGLEFARRHGLAALLVWREGDRFESAMTPAFAAQVQSP